MKRLEGQICLFPSLMNTAPKKKKRARPEVGSVLYFVEENLYYHNHAAPDAEFVVVEGKVTGYFEGGFVEICMSAQSKRGDGFFGTPVRRQLAELGKAVFYTPQEAAKLAKRYTEERENSRIYFRDTPMRRTWAPYLDGKVNEDFRDSKYPCEGCGMIGSPECMKHIGYVLDEFRRCDRAASLPKVIEGMGCFLKNRLTRELCAGGHQCGECGERFKEWRRAKGSIPLSGKKCDVLWTQLPGCDQRIYMPCVFEGGMCEQCPIFNRANND